MGLTCISEAANRRAVGGWSGSILPAGVASCSRWRWAGAAELRIVLRRMGLEMKLGQVGFLLQELLLLRERPVTAARTPSGRCGTQACQLWLETKESFFFNLNYPGAIRFRCKQLDTRDIWYVVSSLWRYSGYYNIRRRCFQRRSKNEAVFFISITL